MKCTESVLPHQKTAGTLRYRLFCFARISFPHVAQGFLLCYNENIDRIRIEVSAMHDVFISYSNKDTHTMELICKTFENNGIRCWYAPRDIAPGNDWRQAIIEAISASRVFVLVYSKYSNQSRQVLNEVTAAFNASCVIIPFRIDEDQMTPALSYYLDNLHWMDALSSPRNAKVDKLCRMVQGILGETPAPAEVPQPAPRPTVRRRTALILAILAILGCIGLGIGLSSRRQTDIPFPDDPAAIETAYGSVVQVTSYYMGQFLYSGVGFACFDEDIIITNAYIVDILLSDQIGLTADEYAPGMNFQIIVSTDSGLTLTVSKILALDSESGVAILSTSGSHGLPLLQTGNSDAMQRGEKIAMLSPYIAMGEYLDKDTSLGSELIVFSAAAVEGCGGSPIMDSRGNVIGMMHVASEYYCYAIPIEQIISVWNTCQP